MKKLMIMLGAVATAIGLQAAATSFESTDDGVADGKFTPSGASWTWAGDPLSLGAYAGDAYTYTGAGNTRNSSFANQASFLPLETGNDVLLAPVASGDVYFDQLVKFTGFEEPQTNLTAGTKIAVWMSGIETEGEEGQDGYVAGETNLYVTCYSANSVDPIALQIAGNYALDTWYRVTIKDLGNIMGLGTRNGFVVYIDGVQAVCVSDDALSLVDPDAITAEAKSLQSAKKLFVSLDSTSATIANVGYQGIGAIDDVTIDNAGPEFCSSVTVNVTIPEGVELAISGGEFDFDPDTKKLTCAPNAALVFTYTAKNGYIMSQVVKNHTIDGSAINDSEFLDPQPVIVKVQWGDPLQSENFATVATALAKVRALEEAGEEEIEVIAQAAIAPTAIPGFGSIGLNYNASILVTEGEWDFSIAPASLIADIAADCKVTADANAALTYAGYVAGTLEADTLAIAADTNIILVGEGKVVVTESQTLTAGIISGEANKEVVYDNDAGAYVLQASATPILKVGDDEFTTAADALAAVKAAELAGNLPVTVVALDNASITVDTQTINLAKDNTIVVNTDSWTFNAAFDGTVTLAPGKSIIAKGLAAGAAINAPTGYKLVTTPGENDVVTYEVAAVTYVAQVGDDKYETLAAAFAAAQADAKIELLDNVALTETLAVDGFAGTLDLGGYELTYDAGLVGNLMTVTNSTIVITNGTMTIANHAVRFRAETVATIAANTTVNMNGTYVFEADGATLNVYGTVTNVADEVPAIHTAVDGSTINVYTGAVVTANGDAIRSNPTSGACAINIYGGTISSVGGYPTIYAYKAGNTSVITIYGGTLNANAGQCILNVKDGGATVTPLTDACKAKFKTNVHGWNEHDLAYWCAPGYKPVLVEGYYEIKAITYATLTVDADAGVVSYVLSNATAEVTLPYQADVDAAEVITAYVTEFASGKELDADNSTMTVTLSANATITIATKDAAAPQGWDNVPAGDNQSAKDLYGISSESKLANVDAGKLGAWATDNSVDFETFKANPDAYADAFLLNCAPTTEAVNTAKESFKFSATDLAALLANPSAETLATLNSVEYPNATIVITKSLNVDGTGTATSAQAFFTATLAPVAYEPAQAE